MEKKLVYIGIALIIIAFVILIANSFTSSIGSSFANIILYKNISIGPQSSGFLAMSASENSYIFIIARSSGNVNSYLFNGSAYARWVNRTGSGLSSAMSLEGKGAFVIFRNTTNMSIPNSTNPAAVPLYALNQTKLFAPGAYYFVIDNSNGSASSHYGVNVVIAYLPPINNASISSGALAGISGQLTEALEIGVLFFVMLVAGLVVLVYGIVKKQRTAEQPKPQQVQKLGAGADKEYVDSLYKNIEKKRTKKKGG